MGTTEKEPGNGEPKMQIAAKNIMRGREASRWVRELESQLVEINKKEIRLRQEKQTQQRTLRWLRSFLESLD